MLFAVLLRRPKRDRHPLPRRQVPAANVCPVHVAPLIAVRIVLKEQVVPAVVKQRTVRVIEPAGRREYTWYTGLDLSWLARSPIVLTLASAAVSSSVRSSGIAGRWSLSTISSTLMCPILPAMVDNFNPGCLADQFTHVPRSQT